ncbi:pilus assembly protein Flp/PilA [Bacillus mesophilus]|uniref:Flp family type IVb pilin n=1 Tax=Bacillus mesophilus TaxID=1808955 RepID=A0A6M0Q476_9BACI|nr:Flp family type IVb pilin [Bacillus mesophilus]MBM7660301.1 pilus assembly protein Flp/PilA [Bacillus mesophilus]MBM7660302.1 pilus assembly protein Flp/PilA [Bacillus mesophilus]NEY71014.1 Flp family type IVb pilin [Bacillus mesophilus]NEY71015.1 Flp family type IVb pilin [Bacillus mesophilus]
MMNKLKGLVVEEQGQGMTEYGLVLGIIAVAVVGFLVTLRGEITAMFQDAVTSVQGRQTGDGSGN